MRLFSVCASALLAMLLTSGCDGLSGARTAKEYFEDGVALAAKGEFVQARKALTKVTTPSSYQELAELLIELIDQVAAHKVEPTAAMHIFKGADDVGRKRLDGARDAYHKATALEANNAVAHFLFGAIFSLEFDYMAEEAIAAHQVALTLDPTFAKAHNFIGVAYAKRGMWEQAVAAHKQAITIDPADAAAHTNLGVRYGEKGMWNEAISAHEKAIECYPTYSLAYMNLATAYGALEMWDKALNASKRAVALSPNSPEAQYNLGSIYAWKRMHDLAISAYKKAIVLDENSVKAREALAVAYQNSGKLELARNQCDEVLKLGQSPLGFCESLMR